MGASPCASFAMGQCACNPTLEEQEPEQNVHNKDVKESGFGSDGGELIFLRRQRHETPRDCSPRSSTTRSSPSELPVTDWPLKVSSGGLGLNVQQKPLVVAAMEAEKAAVADAKADAHRRDEERAQSKEGKQEPRREDSSSKDDLIGTFNSEGSNASLDVSARHQAYLKRKKERQNRKKSKGKDSMIGGPSTLLKDGFLSNVPEVEADVQYRFIFAVFGAYASRVVEAACNSPAAKGLPHAAAANEAMLEGENFGSERSAEPSQEMDDERLLEEPIPADQINGGSEGPLSGAASPKRPGAFRCLCPVPFPWGRTNSTARLKLAKLVFRPVQLASAIPECTSKLEALSCALVFLVILDPLDDGEIEPLHKQLQDIADILDDMRFRIRPEFRQTKAFVLCRISEEADGIDDSWQNALEDFEADYGAIWKFGPIQIRDGDEYHAAFAKIASQRILKQQSSDEDSDVSVERPMPVYETEGGSAQWDEPVQSNSGFLSKTIGSARSLLSSGRPG